MLEWISSGRLWSAAKSSMHPREIQIEITHERENNRTVDPAAFRLGQVLRQAESIRRPAVQIEKRINSDVNMVVDFHGTGSVQVAPVFADSKAAVKRR